MRSKHPPKNPSNNALPFAADNFPALRSFLRGYFHQDMKDEYGSAVEAAREFCEDAGADERAAVAKEWSAFLAQTEGQSLEQINRLLTGKLGSSYSLTEEDLPQISNLLRTDAPKKR
jgi:hypothetical protein